MLFGRSSPPMSTIAMLALCIHNCEGSATPWPAIASLRSLELRPDRVVGPIGIPRSALSTAPQLEEHEVKWGHSIARNRLPVTKKRTSS